MHINNITTIISGPIVVIQVLWCISPETMYELAKQRFNFGDRIETIKTADFTNEMLKLNGTEKFQRIQLQEIDIDSLKLPYEKIKKHGWRNNKPLSSGVYKVTYNQTDYFMTYLDELDLFKSVVLQ